VYTVGVWRDGNGAFLLARAPHNLHQFVRRGPVPSVKPRLSLQTAGQQPMGRDFCV